MARQPRYMVSGQPFHVIQRGNNRSAIFHEDADYSVFRHQLLEACRKHGCAIHAYVFMTNHVHLLMTSISDEGIGSVMQSLGRRYVRYFNYRYERTGGLWEGRYRATLVDSDRYLFSCYRYIELNPVRAGLVNGPEQYRWSSYAANGRGIHDPLVTPHERFCALGRDEDRYVAYRALFLNSLDASTIDEIRDATNKGWALGRISEDTAPLLNRRANRLVPGRPRKNGV